MIRFLARRTFHALILVFVTLTATFFVIRLAPGDPARSLDPAVPLSQAEIVIALPSFYYMGFVTTEPGVGHLDGHLKDSGSPPKHREKLST